MYYMYLVYLVTYSQAGSYSRKTIISIIFSRLSTYLIIILRLF